MSRANNALKVSKSSFIQSQIKSHSESILTVAEKYIKTLIECSDLLIDFIKTMKFEKEGSKTKLMLLLTKYGSKSGLMSKTKLLKWEEEAARKDINQLIEGTQQILQKGTLMCPKCDGKGRITKVSYIREDGMVTPHSVGTTCPICNGEGSVSIPEELQEYLTLILRGAKDMLELGRICNKTFHEITALYEISEDVSREVERILLVEMKREEMKPSLEMKGESRIPHSKKEMLDWIKQEAERHGYSFSQVTLGRKEINVFSIKAEKTEIRGDIRESGRRKTEYPKRMWIGIYRNVWDFLKELDDDSRSFIIILDYLKDNFLTIPFLEIPNDNWYPYGHGMSFTLVRANGSYSINNGALPTHCINNLECLFKPLKEPASKPNIVKVAEEAVKELEVL